MRNAMDDGRGFETTPLRWVLLSVLGLAMAAPAPRADTDVYILDVPDYTWYAGCFGTATGNFFGFWDRNGFPNFYTGPTAGGIAPLNSNGANVGIRSLWASKAGFDGRPASRPGHVDDYWNAFTALGGGQVTGEYESTYPDPYVQLGRPEHTPDCIGDFIGLSQKKWTNMNGECDGNINAYSFVYWDTSGNRRVNYTPATGSGQPAVDIQSGLRAWTNYRGYDADVFTQLADFNPATPAGKGFTFEDLKAEINAGYPVMVFLQNYSSNSRNMSNPTPMPKANPEIHGMVIYGYQEFPGFQVARIRTSWGSGDDVRDIWNSSLWRGILPVRGVIGYHPKPKMVSIKRNAGNLELAWDGPSAKLYNVLTTTTKELHRYVVERSETLDSGGFAPVTAPSSSLSALVPEIPGSAFFYRVKLVQ